MSELFMKLAEGMTDEQLEHMGNEVSELAAAARENPELMEKFSSGFWERFSGNMERALPAAMATTATTAALAGGVGIAQKAYDDVRNSIDKARSYKAMMTEHGDRLKGIPANRVQMAFNTLHRFNPDFAKDPLVAAEFIRQSPVASQPDSAEGMNLMLIKQLVDARKDRGRGSSFLDYAQLAPRMSTGGDKK